MSLNSYIIRMILLCSLIHITGSCVFAQNSAQKVMEIRYAYEQLNFQEAEIKAQSALKEYHVFSAAQLTEIHKILGFIYFSQNQSLNSKEQFKLALQLTPGLKLDSMYVSPKIMTFFTDVKKETPFTFESQTPQESQTRYIIAEDPRRVASLKSLALPGLGQLHKGQKTKGAILITLWSVSVTSATTAYFLRDKAEKKYLTETDPLRIEKKYQDFNKLHKICKNFAFLAVGVWVFSYFDAILVAPSPKWEECSIQFSATSRSIGVAIKL